LLIYTSLWLGQKSVPTFRSFAGRHRPGGRERPLPDSRCAANRPLSLLAIVVHSNAVSVTTPPERIAVVSAGWFMARRAANSATRLPRCFAVSKSPDRGASSGEASAGEIASAPANPAVQFKSAGPLSFVLAGRTPVPIQIWPCCCDNVQK